MGSLADSVEDTLVGFVMLVPGPSWPVYVPFRFPKTRAVFHLALPDRSYKMSF